MGYGRERRAGTSANQSSTARGKLVPGKRTRTAGYQFNAKRDIELRGDAGFRRLADGTEMRFAPDSVRAPKAVVDGMRQSMRSSFPDGKPQEQGGNLVRNRDRSYDWRPGGDGMGDGAYWPDEDNVGKGQKLIGIGHTHPYEDDADNSSFSGEDLAGMILSTEQLHFVQSGETLFMVARTDDFDVWMSSLESQAEINDMEDEMVAYYERCFAGAKGTFAERVELAVRETCTYYHLLYYAGTGSRLERRA